MRNIFLPWHWKRTVKAGLDAQVGYVLTALNDVRTQIGAQLAQQATELSELREELYSIRHTLSRQLDDASWHKLKSASWDVQKGLAAVKNEIASQVGFSLHDIAKQTADQRFWLERINDELAGLRAQLSELYQFIHGTSLTAQSGDTTNRAANLATTPQNLIQSVEVDQPAVGDDRAGNGEFDFTPRQAGTR